MNAPILIDINIVSPLLEEHGVSCVLQGVWNPNPAEQAGAWDIVVELVTRISVVGLNMMKEGSTPLSRATRRSLTWAALRCSGTDRRWPRSGVASCHSPQSWRTSSTE